MMMKTNSGNFVIIKMIRLWY